MRKVTEELKDSQRDIVDSEIKRIKQEIAEIQAELAELDPDDYGDEIEDFEEDGDVLIEKMLQLKDELDNWKDEYAKIERGYSELCLSPEELFLGE